MSNSRTVHRPCILLLNEFPSLNGGERSMLAMLRLLRDTFHFIAAVPPEGDLQEALTNLAIETLPLRIENSGVRNTSELIDEHLLSLIECSQPDLVHANSLNMSRHLGRISQRVAETSGIPLVGHCRDIYGLSRKAIDDINALDRMIHVSQATRRFHVEQGMNPQRSQVIYNGVDLQEFAPRPATGYLHEELGIPRDASLLLSVGQIGMRKGLDFLLSAFEECLRRGLPSHLLVVGERHSNKPEAIAYEQNLHERSQSSPLAGNVHFSGRRNHIANMMNEATMLVHAARQEPLGRVLLEACASGLPAIATDVGGTSEILAIPNRTERIIIPPNDMEGFANAIQMMHGKRNEQSLRIAIRKQAEQQFDIALTASQMQSFYTDMLKPGTR